MQRCVQSLTVTLADGTEFVQVAGRPPGQQRAERHSAGRPETIESIFYLWRTTGDQIWQERGWAMRVGTVGRKRDSADVR